MPGLVCRSVDFSSHSSRQVRTHLIYSQLRSHLFEIILLATRLLSFIKKIILGDSYYFLRSKEIFIAINQSPSIFNERGFEKID